MFFSKGASFLTAFPAFRKDVDLTVRLPSAIQIRKEREIALGTLRTAINQIDSPTGKDAVQRFCSICSRHDSFSAQEAQTLLPEISLQVAAYLKPLPRVDDLHQAVQTLVSLEQYRSRTPEILKNTNLVFGSLLHTAKCYHSEGTLRAVVGLSSEKQYLWEVPFVTLGVGPSPASSLHMHRLSPELIAAFEPFVLKTAQSPTDTFQSTRLPAGTATTVAPGIWHQIELENSKMDPFSFSGIAVRFPASVIDRVNRPSAQNKPVRKIPFGGHGFSVKDRGLLTRWHVVFNPGEGRCAASVTRLPTGRGIAIQEFAERAPASINLTILASGHYTISKNGETQEIEGNSLVMSNGEPFEIRCTEGPGVCATVVLLKEGLNPSPDTLAANVISA